MNWKLLSFQSYSRRKSVFLEKMWKKTLARHNITYHLSSTVILKKSVPKISENLCFPSSEELEEWGDGVQGHQTATMLNGAIGTLGPKPGRSHIFLINSGSLNLRKNVSKLSVPVDTSFGKKHRLGRSELGFSPANSANKFSSSEVQIAMLAFSTTLLRTSRYNFV